MRGLVALLVLGGVLLAGQSRTAAAAHHAVSGYVMLIAAGVSHGAPSPCSPDEPRGIPCCQTSACSIVVAPPQIAAAVTPPVAGRVVAFLLLAPCQPGGTIPDPALRPPRAVI
ncbi:MAG: hypothetical protein KGK10_01345 [Rhodospirillales bacterium]|nr:hypothetical protein [Rhodospirillales bacterium]